MLPSSEFKNRFQILQDTADESEETNVDNLGKSHQIVHWKQHKETRPSKEEHQQKLDPAKDSDCYRREKTNQENDAAD